MWALRGGGGDFGIVVAAEIDLYPATELYGGKLLFPIEAAPAVFDAFVAITRQAPPELTLWAALLHMPPLPMLPEPLRGKSFATVDVTFLGPAAEAEALLAPLRAAGSPVHDTLRPLDVAELGGVSEEPTNPSPAVSWSSLLTGFDARAAARLLETAGDRTRTPLMTVQVRHLGGALADPGRRPAVVSRVPEPFMVFALGMPATPELAAALPLGFAAVADALTPEATGRTVPTFLGVTDTLARAFSPEQLGMLVRVKQSADPAGTIRGNYPVEATAAHL